MNQRDAQERTDALAQVAGGMNTTAEGFVRMMAAEVKLGTHSDLGLSREEWVAQVDVGRLRYTISADGEARERVAGLLTAPVEDGGHGLSNRAAADVLGVDESTVRADKESAGNPAPKEEPSAGNPAPTGKEQAAEETRKRREASRSAPVLSDGLEFREGDAREVLADVPDSSTPLILTDPPYGDDAEPLYRWLAEWSARVLSPGGSLIVYTGQSRLDRDIEIFGEHLRYWWLLTMLHSQAQRLPGKFVMAEFKPVLWFVKHHRRGHSLVNDVLRPPKDQMNKDDHDWGQGEGGVTFLIEKLTDPGERILDPFAGTGRWGQIAVSMGRRWLGADIASGGTETVAA